VSPDHLHLAFVHLDTGKEQGTLFVYSLKNGSSAKMCEIENVYYFVWTADSFGVYYTQLDNNLRASKVYSFAIYTTFLIHN
jgi:protease II